MSALVAPAFVQLIRWFWLSQAFVLLLARSGPDRRHPGRSQPRRLRRRLRRPPQGPGKPARRNQPQDRPESRQKSRGRRLTNTVLQTLCPCPRHQFGSNRLRRPRPHPRLQSHPMPRQTRPHRPAHRPRHLPARQRRHLLLTRRLPRCIRNCKLDAHRLFSSTAPAHLPSPRRFLHLDRRPALTPVFPPPPGVPHTGPLPFCLRIAPADRVRPPLTMRTSRRRFLRSIPPFDRVWHRQKCLLTSEEIWIIARSSHDFGEVKNETERPRVSVRQKASAQASSSGYRFASVVVVSLFWRRFQSSPLCRLCSATNREKRSDKSAVRFGLLLVSDGHRRRGAPAPTGAVAIWY